MSSLIQAMTSDNDEEIMESLNLVRDVSHIGLVHESIDVNNSYEYTRKYSPMIHPDCQNWMLSSK